MQSRTSWFNKEIILQGLRSSGWIGAIYFIALLFAIPLRLIMIKTSEYPEREYYIVDNLFSYNNDIQIILMLGIPILTAIFMFRFMQVKQSSDLFHSLPMRRGALFNHHYILGIGILVIPVLLITILMMVMQPIMELDEYYSLGSIFHWAFIILALNLLFFSAGTLIGTLSGISIIQGVLTYIFLLFPVGISILVGFHIGEFTYGYASDYYTKKIFEQYFSPITRILDIQNFSPTNVEIISYIVIALLLYVIAIWLYKRRNLESAGSPIVFAVLKPIFKYGVTFCFMLFAGLYFGEVQESIGWTIFGYIVGAIIGYLIADMILQKTWRIKINIIGFAYYSIVVAGIFILIISDATGYEKRTPEIDDIERIYLNDMAYHYMNLETENIHYLQDRENIESVIRLHEKIISEKEVDIDSSKQLGRHVFIVYELKNGNKMVRQYTVEAGEKYASYLKPIYESIEYKKIAFNLLNLSSSDVETIRLSPSGPVSRSVSISDEEEIETLLQSLKKDIESLTYDQIQNQQGSLSNVEVGLKSQEEPQINGYTRHYFEHYSLQSYYYNTISWLKEHDKFEEASIIGNDFQKALIIKSSQELKDFFYKESPKSLLNYLEKQSDVLTITDKEQIIQAWEQSTHQLEGQYFIAFVFDNNEIVEMMSFKEGKVPSFIKSSLK
ncbi:DUF6449 domain-containing protein [Bacillus salitolerans]|uniref:DUF6449 domain-containing protein n=1 Tax=Bacillus salitolerans TaxID=1437434 RepID=A0ABW4LRB4_9BACI